MSCETAFYWSTNTTKPECCGILTFHQITLASFYGNAFLYWIFVRESTGDSTAWWRHQMETFSALLSICAGNSPVPDEFPAQRPVTRSFDVSFDLRLNKRLRKLSWGWWFETLSRPLLRHCNGWSVDSPENSPFGWKLMLLFVEETVWSPLTSDVLRLMRRHCNDFGAHGHRFMKWCICCFMPKTHLCDNAVVKFIAHWS